MSDLSEKDPEEAPPREAQPGALGVMFFAAAAALGVVLTLVATAGYLLMR